MAPSSFEVFNLRLAPKRSIVVGLKASLFATGIVLALLTGCSEPEQGRGDMKMIQGTWKIVSLEANGKQAPAEIVDVLKLVFKNDTLTFTPGEPGFTNYRFKLDSTAAPPSFAMIHADGPAKDKAENGTYVLKGDRLEIRFWSSNQIPSLAARAEAPAAVYKLVRLP